MTKKLIFTLICLLSAAYSFADTSSLKNFVVKANPFAKDEIAIVAADTANEVDEVISGSYVFSVNGFVDTLNFDKGTAFYHHKIQRSSFVYIKHSDDTGTYGSLFYLYKHEHDITPLHISWIWLLVIPVAIILAGWLFKKFIIIAVILFIIFLYFNYHNGLSVPTFFESVFDGLKRLF
ncbi:hypothetical protein [Mucilaginibacter ginkgonis]|uniref:Uncharacterized protein n=1 Tax=Mucilaginibacter ginkgonis TaxID=2682091 RepID=A0A6I4IP41_9SPHI|nr:hypothetical protein [Mucilaginibacter ginkgonis]QQL50731.1 hypothetical protein GO620_004535 [Mucilaginibacter ginkgonis]